ncbi:MAG: MBL fold metallo-hydrolase [Flammeovirgaceae bacterium]
MKIQLIRNATLKIQYGGHTILADPMLSQKGAFDSFAGIERNPTVNLPISTDEILNDIECVLVSHNHPDHFDGAATELIAKDLPIFGQPGDATHRTEAGFTHVTTIEDQLDWNGIKLNRTGGKHGQREEILKMMGNVSGFVFQAAGEPTLYWIGDSVWCEEVSDAIEKYQPDVIITHSGGAHIQGSAPIIMDADQTIITAQAAPKAKVVAIHMESLDHCPVTREQLRATANDANIQENRLFIPADGEVLEF